MAICDQRTGAAEMRFVVNTAAALQRGPLLTSSAISGPPDDLMPAAIPEAVNPAGVVTLTGQLLGQSSPSLPESPSRYSSTGWLPRRCLWSDCRRQRPQ